MSREYIVYSTLLVLSLLAAYLSSIADKTVGERAQITVFSVALAAIERAHYRTSQQDFTLTRAADGKRLVVKQVQRRQLADKQDDKSANKPAAATTETLFLANEDFATVLAGFTPLLAKRVLGQATAVDLALFGLKDDKARLELQLQNAANIVFDVGKKSYGSSEFYVQYDGTVYLVAGRSIDKIARARVMLFEEQFMAVAFNDGLTAELQANNTSMTAVLQGTLAPVHHGQPRAASDGKWLVGGQEHSQFANWLRRLRGMQVRAYQRELPANAKQVMTLILRQDDDELEQLRFWQGQNAKGNPVYVVQSKFSGDLYAQLPAGRMEQLTQDLRHGALMPAVQ